MSLTIKAATAMHFAGAAYAAGDTIDTTGMDDRSIAVLLKHQPVYVASAASSAPGTPHIVSHAFTFDTPGLTDGVPFYTPAVGEIILDGWVEITEAWDGTTPKMDFGQGLAADPAYDGWLSFINLPFDATQVDNSTDGNWIPIGMSTQSGLAGQSSSISRAAPSNNRARYVPARFTDPTPVKVWVSQTGNRGGADPGATQGAATICLLVASPSA